MLARKARRNGFTFASELITTVFCTKILQGKTQIQRTPARDIKVREEQTMLVFFMSASFTLESYSNFIKTHASLFTADLFGGS